MLFCGRNNRKNDINTINRKIDLLADKIGLVYKKQTKSNKKGKK